MQWSGGDRAAWQVSCRRFCDEIGLSKRIAFQAVFLILDSFFLTTFLVRWCLSDGVLLIKDHRTHMVDKASKPEKICRKFMCQATYSDTNTLKTRLQKTSRTTSSCFACCQLIQFFDMEFPVDRPPRLRLKPMKGFQPVFNCCIRSFLVPQFE